MVGGIVFFVNLWIRFVESMIRKPRAAAKNVFGCRSLFFLFLLWVVYIWLKSY